MSKDFIEDLVGTKWLCIDEESKMFGEVHEVIYGFVDLSYRGNICKRIERRNRMRNDIGVRVGLHEEVMIMRGYQGESLEAEVIIPLRMVLENERDFLNMGVSLVGLDIEFKSTTIKGLIDQMEDYDVPKRLTGYVLEEIEHQMRVSVSSIDKVFKLAVIRGVSLIGTEWEYQDEYEFVLVNELIDEEDKEEYERYFG